MKAINVAKYIIDFCNKRKQYMSCRKLQSTLYFLQADFLVNEKRPLFKDDLLAYEYGVVIKEVEKWYKVYGNASIPSWPSYDSDLFISYKEKERIREMLKRLDQYTSTDLLEIIFRQEPFRKNKGSIISLEDLYNFFKD